METLTAPRRIEFTGWMPVYERFGNCGNHPQFAHTEEPPQGFHFVKSAPKAHKPVVEVWQHALNTVGHAVSSVINPVLSMLACPFKHGPWRTAQTIAGLVSTGCHLLRQTGSPLAVAQFLHSRHFESQVLLPSNDDLLFLTSVPYTYGHRPWVIEIEDSTTLFYPFIRNGQTYGLDPRKSPYFHIVKALLEADNCRGIITHIRSTAESLPKLFQSEIIARKTFYVPLGVALPTQYQRHNATDDTVDLLYTNSWHQDPNSFFLRGGMEVLDAFDILKARYPQLRLTIRGQFPRLPSRYIDIIERNWVRIFGHFITHEKMDELLRSTHVFLLPAARIHIVSVLKAMAYGQAVVVSDGWGMQEHVEDGVNGIVIPGRAGKASWLCEETGLLREDYRVMKRANPDIIEGIVHAVSRLVEDRMYRRQLGRNARAFVEQRHNLSGWNEGLQKVFEQATANRA